MQLRCFWLITQERRCSKKLSKCHHLPFPLDHPHFAWKLVSHLPLWSSSKLFLRTRSPSARCHRPSCLCLKLVWAPSVEDKGQILHRGPLITTLLYSFLSALLTTGCSLLTQGPGPGCSSVRNSLLLPVTSWPSLRSWPSTRKLSPARLGPSPAPPPSSMSGALGECLEPLENASHSLLTCCLHSCLGPSVTESQTGEVYPSGCQEVPRRWVTNCPVKFLSETQFSFLENKKCAQKTSLEGVEDFAQHV